MSETNRIEYKQALTRDLDIEKEVIAFLNYYEGGKVIIGVNKEGVTLGVDDLDGDMLKIKDRLKNNIKPSCMGLYDVVADVKDGKYVITTIIASGPEKPYHISKSGMSEKDCFTFSNNFLRITLPKVSNAKGGQESGQVGGQVGGQEVDLTPRQKDVLELIIKTPTISRRELAQELDINESAVQKHTDALKSKGVIERDGVTTGKWIKLSQ